MSRAAGYARPAADADDAGGLWERVLEPLGRDLESRAEEISTRLVERQRRQLPEMFPDPEAIEARRASMEASVRALARIIGTPGDPEPFHLPTATAAFARASARQGVLLQDLLRQFRLANQAFWDEVLGELASRAANLDELELGSRICSERLFAYLDNVLVHAHELYADERRSYEGSAAAATAQVITAILEQRDTDGPAASHRLGYELDRYHVGLCAWIDRAADYEDSHVLLRQSLREVGRALGGTATLFHPMGLLAGAAWVSASAPPELDQLEGSRLELAGTTAVRVAVGAAEHGIAGFRATYLEALATRRIATLCGRPEGSVTRYGAVALQALATVDLDQAEAFYRRELGPLAEPTDHARRLRATLHVYLEENASRGRTARRLGVHENTIAYRVRQAEELLGRSLERDTVNLQVALELEAVVGRAIFVK